MHYIKVALSQYWRNSLHANLNRNGMNRIVEIAKCVLSWVFCVRWVCLYLFLLLKIKTTQKADKKNKDETICVCWTVSFSFIAIIMKLTPTKLSEIACCFPLPKKQGQHTLNIFARKTVQLIQYLFLPFLTLCFRVEVRQKQNFQIIEIYVVVKFNGLLFIFVWNSLFPLIVFSVLFMLFRLKLNFGRCCWYHTRENPILDNKTYDKGERERQRKNKITSRKPL